MSEERGWPNWIEFADKFAKQEFEENKKMDVTQEYPYIDASRIVLTEEHVTQSVVGGNAHFTTEWTASINASPHKRPSGLKEYGPTVDMSRTGKSAREAFTALTEALTAEGWTVR